MQWTRFPIFWLRWTVHSTGTVGCWATRSRVQRFSDIEALICYHHITIPKWKLEESNFPNKLPIWNAPCGRGRNKYYKAIGWVVNEALKGFTWLTCQKCFQLKYEWTLPLYLQFNGNCGTLQAIYSQYFGRCGTCVLDLVEITPVV